ncbi:MAG TPA: FKBP-type peptidyl-prolyl cis-trans isomerase [Thermoanaerobaculia bacterium]|nr:FKBP-type peptidyl-prolyl cis-trans isomerase [Thermoanaerobaculia bacterium]
MRANPAVRALLWALLAAAGTHGLVAQSERDRPAGREIVLPSGLRYQDLKVGEGEQARDRKILEIHYTGWLADGTKFDSTQDSDLPLTLRLGAGDVVKGLDEGLAGMREGGKRRLIVPPELGFGKEGGGGVIPPNATLLYEVELLAVR